MDLAEGAPTGFSVASDRVLSEIYGHDGPGVCLGDGQTEAEKVPSQSGRGDALLRRLPPYLTLLSSFRTLGFNVKIVSNRALHFKILFFIDSFNMNSFYFTNGMFTFYVE